MISEPAGDPNEIQLSLITSFSIIYPFLKFLVYICKLDRSHCISHKILLLLLPLSSILPSGNCHGCFQCRNVGIDSHWSLRELPILIYYIVLNWYEMAPNVHGNNWTYKEIGLWSPLPCGLQLQLVKQQYSFPKHQKITVTAINPSFLCRNEEQQERGDRRLQCPQKGSAYQVHHEARECTDHPSSWVWRMLYRCWDLSRIHLY